MNSSFFKLFIWIGLLPLFIFTVPQYSYSAALNTGGIYTITVDAISNAGTVVSLGLRAIEIADSNGKLLFSLGGVPTSGSYNFLLVTIKDSNGNTVRRSIVPAPAPGSALNLGVSPMTEKQTEAMLSALQTAGTDDPILVLFGCIIIRSGGFSTTDINHIANIGRLAIKGPNGNDTVAGMNYYLLTKITAAQMATFRSSIVSNLANYTSVLKDSVTAANNTSSANERAEAGAMLSQILIDSAAAANFDVGYINAAMNAASDQCENYLLGDGSNMDENAVAAMDRVMMTNYMKLSAERVRKKYTTALTTLGASSVQINRLNTAITTLSNSLLSAFQQMEQAFSDEEASLSGKKADIVNKCDTAQAAINTAFTQFQSDSAATDAEIGTADGTDLVNGGTGMLGAILKNFMGISTDNATTLNNMKNGGMFQFRSMGSTAYNWPITMVVPVTWVANTYGNNITYTRDTVGIPTAMGWLAARTNFSGGYGMPAGIAALFGLREDIDIIMSRKWGAMAAASRDMTANGYGKLVTAGGADLTTANAQRAAADPNKLGVIGTDAYAGTADLASGDDAITDDDTEGATLANFNQLGNLNPWLTGEEKQGIEDLALGRLTTCSNNITATLDKNGASRSITTAEKEALIQTATMPDFQ